MKKSFTTLPTTLFVSSLLISAPLFAQTEANVETSANVEKSAQVKAAVPAQVATPNEQPQVAPQKAEPSLMEKAEKQLDELSTKMEGASEKVGDFSDKAVESSGKYVSDSTITTKVKMALAKDNLNVAYDISVATKEGVVTLTGFTRSVEDQLKIIELAKQVDGVKAVRDKMHVKSDKEATLKGFTNDTVITSEIKAKFVGSGEVALVGVSVETVDGVVQLSGSLKEQALIDQAETLANAVDGVKTVKNDIALVQK